MEAFLIILSLFANLKLMSVFFSSWMIMIIVIIYIFLNVMWYSMNSWKLLSENYQASLKKSTPPFLLTYYPPKNSKIEFLPTLKIFISPPSPPRPPGRKGGRTLCRTVTKSSSNLVKLKPINQRKICSKFQRCI